MHITRNKKKVLNRKETILYLEYESEKTGIVVQNITHKSRQIYLTKNQENG